MNKLGIPANADNKVVAGENAKAMTKEIIEGFVREAVAGYIDNLVDATWEGFDEYSRIEEDGDGNLWVVDMQFNEGSYDVIWEEIDERCSDEGYNIDLYDWSKENDIDIDHIISEMKKQIVYENNELDWSITGWADYLCVFYKSYFEVTYELDLDICSRIVDIHYELFDNFNSAGVDMAIEKIVYNEHLNAEKHYEAIYEKAYEEYNN